MKGLLVNVYRDADRDCTNGGVTAKAKHCVLRVRGCEVFETDAQTPGLVVVERQLFERQLFGRQVPYLTAYPVDAKGNPRTGGMFGGNFVYTSDSRFPAEYPIPVHDRFEA